MKVRKSKNKKTAKQKADKEFSRFIRLRDADENGVCVCCTCGKRHYWKQIHAGHWRKRDKEATRYDERNVHAQCNYCNTYRGGEEYEHFLHIVEKHGEDVADELYQKSQTSLMKRKQFDYEYIAHEYRQKVKQIAKEKGIEL